MIKKRKIVAGVLLLMLAALAFCGWQVRQFAAGALTIRQDTFFTLPVGSGRVALETALEQQHIIPHTIWFSWLLKLYPELAQFKAGTYRLTPEMSVRQMLLLLRSGKEAQFLVRFVEGSRMRDWLATLRAAPYLRHTLTDDSLSSVAKVLKRNESGVEGWLYPDTYAYTAGTTDVALLHRAHARMVKTVDAIWQQRQADLPYKSQNDLVIMASIVEKETALAEERNKVASVFINRLRLGMRLQTDPTVIYGMGETYSGTLTRKALETPSAYNTYLIAGLPPGAIAMPGKASLQAAAMPLKTDFLYFVANGLGGHTFTTTLANHNQAVQAWRRVTREKNER